MATYSNIPYPQSPFLDSTGRPAREWLLWLQNPNVTSIKAGQTNFTTLTVGTITATGGTLDNVTIGGTIPAAGSFTTIKVPSIGGGVF